MRYGLMTLAVSMLIGTGCDLLGLGGRACTTLYAYGISAHVTDADGQPVTHATLTLHEGDYTEVMQYLPTGDYAGAGERQGTYSMTVEVPGLPSETVDDIVVGFDGCHVIGVAFNVQVESDRIVVTRFPAGT